jgi:hypothetical protein
VCYVRQIDGGGADLLDRQPVEGSDRSGGRVHAHDELLVAHLGVAGRQGQALGIDRIDDIVRRDAVRAHGVGVDVDHDLAIFAAIGGQQGDPGDRRQRLADLIVAVVIELLLVQPVRAQAELQDRHGRGAVLDDGRGLNAGRQQRPDLVGRRDDLRDREIDIDVGLKENLLYRNAR